MAPALALRPQLFGILLFAMLAWLVAGREAHPRGLWLAPLLVALWANMHGSFVLAPALLGYAWLDDVLRGRPARSSLVVLVAGILATFITPLGPGVWAYAAGIGANPVIADQVSEWQRTTPFTVTGLLFYGSVAAVAVAMAAGRSALSLADWGLFAGLVAIGAWTVRGVAWWPIGAVLLVAAALPVIAARAGERSAAAAPGARPRQVGPARLNAVVAVLLGLAVIAALPWWRPVDPLTGRTGLLTYAPSGIAAELQQRTKAGTRVAAPQTWASWLEWAVPDARYFVDSRFELFRPEIWADYARLAAGGIEAARAADVWDVDVVVVPVGGEGPEGWTLIYGDADGVIVARPGSAEG